jgi:hypothetical protein
MPLSGVLELLTLFVLRGADTKDEFLTFGSLDDRSVLGEKVASAIDVMRETTGPQVVITRSAYDHLQAIKRMWEKEKGEVSPEESTKILDRLMGALKSMPAVKTEAEIKSVEARKK